MFVTVGRKDIAIGPKGKVAAATFVSVGLHAFLFWVILQQHYKEPNLAYEDVQPPVDIELYQVVEPPLPKPVIELSPDEVVSDPPVETPPETPPDRPEQAEADPAPTPVQAPQPSPQAALQTTRKTVVQPLPALPDIQVRAKATQDLALQKESAKSLTRQQLSNADSPVPSLTPAPAIRSKKKAEEADALSKTTGAQALSDLDLHQPANAPSVLAASPAPDGGATPAGGGARVGIPSGMPSAGQLAGAINGGKTGGGGDLAGGRGKLTMAMQNHDFCNEKVEKGKPVPANCKMDTLKGQTYLGLKKDAGLQKAAAARDADRRYKTSPGSQDQWNATLRQPSDAPNKDDQPKYGDYSSGKRQRVIGGCSQTSSCTSDGHETRRPGDPKPGG